MAESPSAITMDKRDRAGSPSFAEYLMRDMANPGMYFPAAFPMPKNESAATLTPKVAESDLSVTNDDADLDRGEESNLILGDGDATRRGRASQALAEMKNAAQQRGLLKASGDSEPRNLSRLAIVGEPAEGTSESTNEIASENSEAVSELKASPEANSNSESEESETGAATDLDKEIEAEGKSSPELIDDTPRRRRLEVLSDWLKNSIGMSEVFLIDSCGYPLLPEKSNSSNGDAAGALHDLGLRMGGILDLAGRRLSKQSPSSVDNESNEVGPGRVARLTLDRDRCLAVAKVAMTHGAERPLLGWVEVPGAPLADSWVDTACDYAAEVLAHDSMS